MSGSLTQHVEELAARVRRLEELTARVERLEELAAQVEHLEGFDRSRQPDHAQPAPARSVTDTALVQRLAAALGSDGDKALTVGSVTYAGVGPWEQGAIAWQMGREWREVLDGSAESSSSLFSALASPTRVRIVAELLHGRLTTAQLAARLDQPSSGQLFHHLKELLSAGLVHQPVRGTYAIRKHHVIPLLTLLSATLDISPPAMAPEEDTR